MTRKKAYQIIGENYYSFLKQIKARILHARIKAAHTVNRELIQLYFGLGKAIMEKQQLYGWGKSIVEKLSVDLINEFPGVAGFSPRNLWDMRRFYSEYKDLPKLRQLVAEIPWGQNLLILNRIKNPKAKEYYLRSTIEMGWSRNVLLNQIKAKAFDRHYLAEKQHNFRKALPEHLAEQADQSMKDVYALDFLGIRKPILERELEKRMVEKVKELILELGYGFSFIGNQYKISLNDKDYYIDLLFYHRKLRCLVALEIKGKGFEPEYAGKMNFYLNLLDDLVKEPYENPSIGIILCAERDRIEVEYALRGIDKPVGVAEYSLTNKLPKKLTGKLPSLKDLETKILKEPH